MSNNDNERPGGSRNNNVNPNFGQYQRSFIIDQPPRAPTPPQQAPAQAQAPAPATSSSSRARISSIITSEAVAAAAPSILNVDHEMIDLVTPPSSQVNNFTPLTQQSTTDSWKKDMFSDDDDNFNGETFVPPTGRTAPSPLLLAGDSTPQSTTDSWKKDMFSDDDHENLVATINLPSTSSSSSSSLSIAPQDIKRKHPVSSSASSSSSSVIDQRSKKRCLPIPPSSSSSSSCDANVDHNLSQHLSNLSTSDKTDDTMIWDDDDDNNDNATVQEVLEDEDDNMNQNDDNDNATVQEVLDTEDQDDNMNQNDDNDNAIVQEVLDTEDEDDNMNQNDDNDNSAAAVYHIEEPPDTDQLSQYSTASWVSDASQRKSFGKKVKKRRKQNLRTLASLRSTPTPPPPPLQVVPPAQSTIATPPPLSPPSPTIASPPPPPPPLPTAPIILPPVASTAHAKTPSVSSRSTVKKAKSSRKSSIASSVRTSASSRKSTKNNQYYTIKFGLKKLCGLYGFTKQQMEQPQYEEKLKLYNMIVEDVKIITAWLLEASIFYNYCIDHRDKWLLNEIANSDKEPKADDIFNRLREDFKGIKKIKQEILDLIEDYNNNRPTDVNFSMLYKTGRRNNMIEESSKLFMTNLKTNINTHGWNRVKKYLLSLTIERNGETEKKYTPKQVLDILLDLFNENQHPNEEAFEGFEDVDFTLFKTKKVWWKFLPFFHNLQTKQQNFVLIPSFSIGLKHIRYSSSGLILLASRYLNQTLKDGKKKGKDLWKEIFPNIPKFDIFQESMTTNGVDVSLLYKKKKTQKQYHDDDDDDDDNKIKLIRDKSKNCNNVITCDPGLRCPLAGVKTKCIEDLGNKNLEKPFCLKISTYRYRVGSFKRAKKLKRITKIVDDQVAKLLLHDNFKGLNLKNPLNYIQNMQWKIKCIDIMFPVYSQLKVTKLSWDKKMVTDSVLDQMANFLVDGVGRKNKKKLKNQLKQIKSHNIQNPPKKKQHDDGDGDGDKTAKKKKTRAENKKQNKQDRLIKLAEGRQKKFTPKITKKRERQRRREGEKNKKKRAEAKKKIDEKYRVRQLEVENKIKELGGEARWQKKRKPIDPNSITLLLMGNTKISKKIQGYVRMASSKFVEKLKRKRNAVYYDVDEYKTTQNCSNCNNKCSIISKWGHRYLYCKICHITWNRDINGGRNIGQKGAVELGLKLESSMANYQNFQRGNDDVSYF